MPTDTLIGMCPVQGRTVSVKIRKIPYTTQEDSVEKYKYGTILCGFVQSGGICTCNTCPIPEQNGIKR